MDSQDGYVMAYGTAKTIEFLVFFGLLFAVGFYQLWDIRRLERQREKARAEAQARGETPPESLSHIPGWLLRR